MSERPDTEKKLASYLHEMLKFYVGSVQTNLRPFSSRGRDIIRDLEGSLAEWDRQIEGLSAATLEEEILREVEGQVSTMEGEWARRFNLHGEGMLAIGKLTASRQQRDVLDALLDVGQVLSNRCFLLLVKRGQATGWDGRGYDENFLSDGLARYNASVAQDGVLAPLVEQQAEVVWSREEFPPHGPCLDIPGFAKPARFILAPLCLFGTVTAVLFIDGDYLHVEADEAVRLASLAMTHAALWLENAAMRRSLGIEAGEAFAVPAAAPAAFTPEPAVAEEPAPPAVEEEPPAPPGFEAAPPFIEAPIVEAPPAEEEYVIPEPEPVEEFPVPSAEHAPSLLEQVFETPAGRPAAPEPPLEPLMLEEVQDEIIIGEEAEPPTVPDNPPVEFPPAVEEIVLEETYDPGRTVLEDMPQLAPSEPIPMDLRVSGYGAADEEIVLEEKPLDELILEETPIIEEYTPPVPVPPPVAGPPKPAAEAKGPLWTTPEEEKLHNDARRFARLLVSEIKLYNEDAVTEGRIEKDLYRRLRKDIERSRDMYDKRVAPAVARKIDYFHEELIRILGESDVAKLGADNPGPMLLK